jgi:hypothetical protein
MVVVVAMVSVMRRKMESEYVVRDDGQVLLR